MVYNSNNIKKDGKTTEDTNPVYPFSVDIASLPERKYLFGIYRLSRLSFVSILLSIILCIIIVIRSFSNTINPYFIHWNKYETRFKELKSNNEPFTNNPIRKLTEGTYLLEYFIRDYLYKTFTISSTLVKNEEIWCNCDTSQTQATDILNINTKCYICAFSAPAVYNSFAQNQKPNYELIANTGKEREIIIINMEQIYHYTTQPDTSFIGRFLPKKNIVITTEYKVDFILEDKQADNIINREVITSYIAIQGLQAKPRERKVTNISYLFNPHYKIIINNYLKTKTQELEEAQNELQ